jgi:CO/xanthine dehydrogenase FAD-binding subunit
LPGAVLALGGSIKVAGPNGERSIDINDCFVDLLATDLQPDELLVAIEVNGLSGKSGSAYVKFEHPASGYAICGAAAVVKLAADGSCESATLCYNGVTAVPLKADAVSDALAGKQLNDAAIDQAIKDAVSIDEPMSDIHASGAYRIELAKVYGRRALKLARDRAQG